MVFEGFIDESYGARQNLFTLSCLLAKLKDWGEIERRWKLCIAAKNKQLKRNSRRPISRYHASDCSGCRNEFRGWSRDERDQFVKELFDIFRSVPTYSVVYDVQLDELCEVFPEWKTDRLEAGYGLLTLFLLNQIALDFGTFACSEHVKISLFHDRTGPYDATILRVFNQCLRDSTFQHPDYFRKIASIGWEKRPALQPADLIAFESFKSAEARLAPRGQRKSFTELLDMAAFGIHTLSYTKDALMETRKLLVEQKLVP